MTIDERVELAKGKTQKIIAALRTLLQVRMNNEIILYSDLLSKQVGKSYAAHSFNVLQGALFESEVVRVCALWDRAANKRQAYSRDSIPAVAWLLSSDEVLEALRAEHVQHHSQMQICPR